MALLSACFLVKDNKRLLEHIYCSFTSFVSSFHPSFALLLSVLLAYLQVLVHLYLQLPTYKFYKRKNEKIYVPFSIQKFYLLWWFVSDHWHVFYLIWKTIKIWVVVSVEIMDSFFNPVNIKRLCEINVSRQVLGLMDKKCMWGKQKEWSMQASEWASKKKIWYHSSPCVRIKTYLKPYLAGIEIEYWPFNFAFSLS